MERHSTWRLRRLCVMGMLCALAFAAVAFIRIPVVLFLKYEPKDVLLTIGGFLFGPVAGLIMAIVVAFLEFITISDTGVIGLAMNILSSGLFVCIPATIYRKERSIKRAVIGLILGVLATTAGMLLWNYLITPLYMQVDRNQIVGLLLPAFLPFNLLKGTLNATLTLLLYKGVAGGLRSAHLLPPAPAVTANKKHHGVWLVTLFVLLSLILVMLAWMGII